MAQRCRGKYCGAVRRVGFCSALAVDLDFSLDRVNGEI
jgi:hypothetical protein